MSETPINLEQWAYERDADGLAVVPRDVAELLQERLATVTAERDAALARAERAEADVQWIEDRLFERKWSGSLGESSKWHLVGPYRHIVQRMRGETLHEAIAATKETKDA